MAISFRANAFGANGALTCNKPSGTLSGDFLIAGVSIFDNTTTVTPPSGWSLVRADFDGVGTRNLIYTLTAGGSEPSSYTWTTSPAAQFTEILIACFTGFTGTPTVDAQGAAGTSTTSCPSVTPTGSADMLWCYFGDNSGISSAYTAPSGMTVETGTADFGNSAAHLLLSSNAATGTKQFSPTTGIGEGTTIALSDVVSGGGGAVVSAAVHGQWPNPLRSTSRVALTRKGATENTDVCAAAEQFYGDGTQLLLANPHGRWPNPLRSTQRMALTTKVRGYNPNTRSVLWRPGPARDAAL